MTVERSNAEDSCLKNQPAGHGLLDSPALENGHMKEVGETKGPILDTTDYDEPTTDDTDRPTSPTSSEASTFPEGGWAGWSVVLGSFCGLFSVYGLINTSAVFETYFKANQLRDYSHSQIGWIFSLYLFLVFFIGVQVGPIFDRYGPRFLVAGGTLCIVVSLMLLSISKSTF